MTPGANASNGGHTQLLSLVKSMEGVPMTELRLAQQYATARTAWLDNARYAQQYNAEGHGHWVGVNV